LPLAAVQEAGLDFRLWRAQHASMSTITFDTLNFAKKLKEAGFSDQQAEIQAQALVQALAEHHERQKEELATKRDLAEAKSDIVKWVAGLLLAQAAIIAALVKLLAN
jgi:hypothetical protein